MVRNHSNLSEKGAEPKEYIHSEIILFTWLYISNFYIKNFYNNKYMIYKFYITQLIWYIHQEMKSFRNHYIYATTY